MDKQKEVLKFLSTVDNAKKNKIYDNVNFGYYHNWQKHLGELLSRMVKNGKLEKVSVGVYKVKQIDNQQQLF